MSGPQQGFAPRCANCHKVRLDCQCSPFRAPNEVGDDLYEGTARKFLEAQQASQEPAPLPGAIARTVGTRVARRMLQMLLDNRVPMSVEYVCSDVMISVPFTFATVLDKIREAAERDLQAGLFAPCEPVKP